MHIFEIKLHFLLIGPIEFYKIRGKCMFDASRDFYVSLKRSLKTNKIDLLIQSSSMNAFHWI